MNSYVPRERMLPLSVGGDHKQTYGATKKADMKLNHIPEMCDLPFLEDRSNIIVVSAAMAAIITLLWDKRDKLTE